MSSLRQRIAALADPAPKDYDPEDLTFGGGLDDTAANKTGDRDADDLGLGGGDVHDPGMQVAMGRSRLRDELGGVSLEEGAYAGVPVSRKQLHGGEDSDSGSGSGSDDDSEDSDGSDDGIGGPGLGFAGNGGAVNGHTGSSSGTGSGSGDSDADSAGNSDSEDSQADTMAAFTAGAGVGGSGALADVDAELEALEEADNLRTMKRRTNADSEAVKAQHTKNATLMWEHGLEARITLQPAIVIAQRLPQPATRGLFVSAPEDAPSAVRKATKRNRAAAESAADAAAALVDDLLELQASVFANSSLAGTDGNDDRGAGDDDDDDDDNDGDDGALGSQRMPKRLRQASDTDAPRPSVDAYWTAVQQSWSTVSARGEPVLNEWHRKLRYSSGLSEKKQLKLLHSDISGQVDAVLENKQRLVTRAQLRTSDAKVVGAAITAPASHPMSGEGSSDAKDAEGEDVDPRDPETFDDSEFYQHLLRAFVESGAAGSDAIDARAASKAKKAKKKKEVDRRASKGRRLRYTVHPKLVNFMAPQPLDASALEGAETLYASLFRR